MKIWKPSSIFIWLLAIILSPFLLFGNLWVGTYFHSYILRIPFDGSKWKDKNLVHENFGGLRNRMLPDLKKKSLRIGTKKDEIISILGEPDSQSKTTLNYFLKSDHGVDEMSVCLEMNDKSELVSIKEKLTWYCGT